MTVIRSTFTLWLRSRDETSCPLSADITSDPKHEAMSPNELTPTSSNDIKIGTTCAVCLCKLTPAVAMTSSANPLAKITTGVFSS